MTAFVHGAGWHERSQQIAIAGDNPSRTQILEQRARGGVLAAVDVISVRIASNIRCALPKRLAAGQPL